MAMHATKIIAQYEQITGEKFQDALERMAREDYTGEQAAHFIGFCDKQRLDIVIARLGYTPVKFRGIKRRGLSRQSRDYHRHKAARLVNENRNAGKPIQN